MALKKRLSIISRRMRITPTSNQSELTAVRDWYITFRFSLTPRKKEYDFKRKNWTKGNLTYSETFSYNYEVRRIHSFEIIRVYFPIRRFWECIHLKKGQKLVISDTSEPTFNKISHLGRLFITGLWTISTAKRSPNTTIRPISIPRTSFLLLNVDNMQVISSDLILISSTSILLKQLHTWWPRRSLVLILYLMLWLRCWLILPSILEKNTSDDPATCLLALVLFWSRWTRWILESRCHILLS